MSGFSKISNRFSVDYQGRTVFDSTGRLVTLVPGSDFGTDATPESVSISYPDFTKKVLYNWRGVCTYNGGGTYSLSEMGQGFISAPKQDWSTTTILAAAPAHCNAFAAKVRINRTRAPSTWKGAALAVKPKSNVWIPFTGSVLLEAAVGMARSMSLYIDGSGNLVLHQQQSTSVPPYWAGNYIVDSGAATMGYGALPIAPGGGTPPTTQQVGEWQATFPVGQVIYTDASMVGGTLTYSETPIIGQAPSYSGGARSGGSLLTDTTNYLSTYSIDIVGEFGRIA